MPTAKPRDFGHLRECIGALRAASALHVQAVRCTRPAARHGCQPRAHPRGEEIAALESNVVAGASLAGLRCAEVLRGSRDEHSLSLAKPEALAALALDLRLGRAAASLDLAAKAVLLEGGERLRFDGLVIATGASPRRLPKTPPLAGPAAGKPFAPVPFVWSDQYDRKIQMTGRVGPRDEMRIVHGTLEERCFVALFGRAGRLVGCRKQIREGRGFADAVAEAEAAAPAR